ncbi:hypothetical protein VP01_10886g1, partial [Puccinia sorghi]
GARPPGHGGPAGICAYCGVKGNYQSQCAELTANLNAQRVRIWQGDFYFPGLWEKIKGIPPYVVAANPVGPSQTKPEATLSSGVVMGAEWCLPVVGAEVWMVQSDERVMFKTPVEGLLKPQMTHKALIKCINIIYNSI